MPVVCPYMTDILGAIYNRFFVTIETIQSVTDRRISAIMYKIYTSTYIVLVIYRARVVIPF